MGVLQWRKRNRLTQVDAAALLGVSQPYLSLLEKGVRPLTADLRTRMKSAGAGEASNAGDADDRFRAQLSRLGYPGFAHIARSRSKPRPDTLLAGVLAMPDADARVAEALPWLAVEFQRDLDFERLVREAKLHNRQNRTGFLLQLAGVHTSKGRLAIQELDRARLLQEDTFCWDSMPSAVREWMRGNRTPLAEHWNVLTRLGVENVHDAA